MKLIIEKTKKITKFSLFIITFWLWVFLKTIPLIILSAAFLILVLFEKRLKVKIPFSISTIFVLFMIATLTLWSYYDFYEKFSWWDDILHFFYGFWFSFIWYIIIQYISIKKWIQNEIFIVIIFSFCFSVSWWAIWEIYEYLIDTYFWMNMQRTEIWTWVTDTMHDIILETFAALITNIYIYIYLKFEKHNWISKLEKDFIKLNKS